VQVSKDLELFHCGGGSLFPHNNFFAPIEMPVEWMEIIKESAPQKKRTPRSAISSIRRSSKESSGKASSFF